MKKPENVSSNRTYSLQSSAWPLAILVVFLDQLTKLGVTKFFPDLVIQNTGTAFGFFGGNNTVLTIISLTIIGVLLRHVLQQEKLAQRKRLLTMALMLIVGGGMGNIVDRLFRGYVVDFIKLPFWPAFNVADACITLGITVLLWQTLFKKTATNEL